MSSKEKEPTDDIISKLVVEQVSLPLMTYFIVQLTSALMYWYLDVLGACCMHGCLTLDCLKDNTKQPIWAALYVKAACPAGQPGQLRYEGFGVKISNNHDSNSSPVDLIKYHTQPDLHMLHRHSHTF